MRHLSSSSFSCLSSPACPLSPRVRAPSAHARAPPPRPSHSGSCLRPAPRDHYAAAQCRVGPRLHPCRHGVGQAQRRCGPLPRAAPCHLVFPRHVRTSRNGCHCPLPRPIFAGTGQANVVPVRTPRRLAAIRTRARARPRRCGSQTHAPRSLLPRTRRLQAATRSPDTW